MSIESRILAELSEGSHVSGEEISRKLDITRSAVWKHISNLRDQGYDIEAAPRRGYILVARPDRLTAIELQNRLDTKVIGGTVIDFKEVGSTADLAREQAAKGAPDGTLITADSQTEGRGRMERGWVTPPGVAVALSVVLYPDYSPTQIPLLGLAAGLAVRKAVASVTGLSPVLKWPNDIHIGGKKLAGVLVEMSAELDRVKWVTVNTGINVKNDFSGTPLEDSATSLLQETGRSVSRLDVAVTYLQLLDGYYAGGLAGDAAEAIRADFEAADMLQGKEVSVRTPSGMLRGTAAGIDADGRLLVRDGDGEVHSLFSGEASLAVT